MGPDESPTALMFAVGGKAVLVSGASSVLMCSEENLDECSASAFGDVRLLAGDGNSTFLYASEPSTRLPDARDGIYLGSTRGVAPVHLLPHTWGNFSAFRGVVANGGGVFAVLIRQFGSRDFGTGGGRGDSVQVWRTSPLGQIFELKADSDKSIEAIALSQDGTLLAVANAMMPSKENGGAMTLYGLARR